MATTREVLPDKPDYRTPDLGSQFHPELTEHFLNRQPLQTPLASLSDGNGKSFPNPRGLV